MLREDRERQAENSSANNNCISNPYSVQRLEIPYAVNRNYGFRLPITRSYKVAVLLTDGSAQA